MDEEVKFATCPACLGETPLVLGEDRIAALARLQEYPEWNVYAEYIRSLYASTVSRMLGAFDARDFSHYQGRAKALVEVIQFSTNIGAAAPEEETEDGR